MSDFRNDPNFVHQEIQEADSRVQWAAVAVILLLVGGLIVAAAWTGGDTQTAMNARARGRDHRLGRLDGFGGDHAGAAASAPALARQAAHRKKAPAVRRGFSLRRCDCVTAGLRAITHRCRTIINTRTITIMLTITGIITRTATPMRRRISARRLRPPPHSISGWSRSR